MRRHVWAGSVLLALALLQGCAGKPYVDSRREAGKKIMVGASNAEVVAICHAGRKPSPEVVKMAESECAKTGRVPQLTESKHYTCALKTSTRSFFKCVAPPPKADRDDSATDRLG